MSRRHIPRRRTAVRTEPVAAAPQLHSIDDVDLSLAKKSCGHCRGRGIAGWRTLADPADESKTLRVAIVCRCVTRNGGVKEDAMAKAARNIQDEIMTQPGVWGARLAADVQRISVDYRAQALAGLRERAATAEMPDPIRNELHQAIAILEADADFLTRPADPPKPAVMPEATSPAEGDTHVDSVL